MVLMLSTLEPACDLDNFDPAPPDTTAVCGLGGFVADYEAIDFSSAAALT